MQDARYDVMIVGGGLVGQCLALALADSGMEQILLIDAPRPKEPKKTDERASAVAAAVIRMFDTLDIWPALQRVAQPILSMDVTDSVVDDPVRPVFLKFDGETESGEPFAHMIPNAAMEDAFAAALERTECVAKVDGRVADVQVDEGVATVTLTTGQKFCGLLVVGADGRGSGVRQKAGIRTVGWPYDQLGLVATIQHEEPHDGRAEEHFLPSGPFAILPLIGNRSSLVWTEKKKAGDALLSLDRDALHGELKRRVPYHYGEVEIVSPVQSYPLTLQLARDYVGPRVALVGDAAHSIHPLAGQGLNLGLRDVAALSEVIVESVRIGLDPGALDRLEEYQRWRRFDVMQFAVVTDVLHRLFDVDAMPLRMIRDVGLGLTDRMPQLKRTMISEAAGMTGDLPKLLRGEIV